MKAQYITINEYGDKSYYADKAMKILHREDGPAFEYNNGGKSWYLNGKLHRIDGPAVEWPNGDKDWCLDGRFISKEEHSRRTSTEMVFTMDEIAAKLGISVEQLKITK